MDDVNPALAEFFAWCFSHGRLHRFAGQPWCTAAWIGVTGVTEADAMDAKRAAWGDARFLDDIESLDEQIAILNQCNAR